jgi:hypothetical protein
VQFVVAPYALVSLMERASEQATLLSVALQALLEVCGDP